MIDAKTVIRVGTAEAARAGVSRGELRVGDTPDGEPVTIPVTIVRGAAEGPVLWINGCVHGDEFCGAFIILCSTLILFQINQIVQGGETNYVSATLTLYMSIYNIFSSLLQILMALTGERD